MKNESEIWIIQCKPNYYSCYLKKKGIKYGENPQLQKLEMIQEKSGLLSPWVTIMRVDSMIYTYDPKADW